MEDVVRKMGQLRDLDVKVRRTDVAVDRAAAGHIVVVGDGHDVVAEAAETVVDSNR